jgi:acetyl esterase/lipase
MKKGTFRLAINLAAFFFALCLFLPVYAQDNLDVKLIKDVVYERIGDVSETLDIYQPAKIGGVLPAVILVHGGGWSAGDKSDFTTLAEGLARAGYVAFNVNYRLATAQGNKYPAQLDDVQTAVRWIRAHAKRYDINPNKLGALGASAGGHLVALLGTMDTRDNSNKALSNYSSRVDCVVDFFGPTDLTPKGLKTYSPLVLSILLNFLGKTPKEAPALYRDASPVYHINAKTVPFLIFQGTSDPLVPYSQSVELYKKLKAKHIEAKLVLFKGEGHGFSKPEDNQTALKDTLAFFAKHLK